MNWHATRVSLATAVLLLCAGGCSTAPKASDGLLQVEDLIGRIERVHVESELAKERLRDALQSLYVLVNSDTGTDPVATYATLVAAVERSVQQGDKLRASIAPMKAAAEPVFARWAEDLEAFRSPRIRQRSELRLANTRASYDAIVAAVDPAQVAYDTFNDILQDHALYLRHDLNLASVNDVQQDITALAQLATELDQQLDRCLLTARTYVESSALPMRIETRRAASPTR